MNVPIATYRLQLHAGFDLAAATRIIPYLHSLGISHVYTSSLLTAKAGSTHGYDVIDHSRLNPEIGTDDDLQMLSRELKARGMGLILDVVPNHMSVGGANAWWQNVLENGPSSPYAHYFDIAWNDHHRDALRGKVLLPILAMTYGEAIDNGAWQLEFANGTFFAMLSGMRLPIDPRSFGLILDPILEELKSANETPNNSLLELQSIRAAIRHLPLRTEPNTTRQAEGLAEIVVIKRRLAEWSQSNELEVAVMRAFLTRLAADPVTLDHLVESQAYRPCYWRVASDEINYRRFFDVNDLAALATEREDVFDDVHALIFEWLHAGIVDGLRIDHPDGLYDPHEYLARLQQRWRGASERPPLFVVVEKILAPNESLPSEWATAGTTGYEFLNAINGLYIDPANEAAFTRTFKEFTSEETPFEEMVYRKKFLILQSSLTSELHMLAGHFDRLAQSERATRDLTLNSLRHALRELLCCFPVYRTYIDGKLRDTDEIIIRRAVNQARRRNPLLGRTVFDYLRNTLLLKDPASGPATPVYREAQMRCTAKFQQLSPPVMAKGFEDTALYLYNRLTSLNEVGGHPRIFGRKPADLHTFFQQRSAGGLSPLSTHDTKRGEDVRARINVLSEIPDEWAEHVNRWQTLNECHRTTLDESNAVPDRNEEYLLYQTLLGIWTVEGDTPTPEFVSRVREYMVKAVQEGKVHTSWINPDAEYLQAVTTFIDRILNPKLSREFLSVFTAFVRSIRIPGFLNSLSQTLLQCTAPGIPDLYQGTEYWCFTLVDPDNRQPVDFDARQRWLSEIVGGHYCIGVTVALDDPRLKLLVTAKALRFRRDHSELFASGDFRPLKALGPAAEHVFAFLRTYESQVCLVVVPRLTAQMPAATDAAWQETRLALPQECRRRSWQDVLANRSWTEQDGSVTLATVFAKLPLALFISDHVPE
ncbi:malto-oligosyltrehalose synthase [soil metagenome]